MPRILLVRPNGNSRFQIVPPLGLLYVAKAAQNAGYEVTVHDAWLRGDSPLEAANTIYIQHSHFDTIGVQLYYDTVGWARDFIDIMNRYYRETHIVVGGPQASAFGWRAARETGADSAHIGPGELMFGAEIPDIPAWELIQLPEYWPHMHSATIPIRGKRPAVIQSSRGCVHHCTFCAGHVVHGRNTALRTPQSVMREILDLKHTCGVDEIWFQDDNFMHDSVRAARIFDWLKTTGLHLRFPNGIRCENINEDVVKLMKLAGVYMVGIGIESGSQRVLREVKKGLRLETVRNAVELFHRYGIMTSGFFIVGLPGETEREYEESVAFACDVPLDRVQVGVLVPYPGSELADMVQSVDTKTLLKRQRSFHRRFYLRQRILWSMLKNIRWSQIKAIWRHPWIMGK